MSCSKPVFAYINDDNEFGKLIEKLNLGYYVCKERNNLDKQLKLLLDDEELMKRKGQNSFKALEEIFSVHKAADQILSKFSLN